MKNEQNEVTLANRAFYDALQARDLDAMDLVWSHGPETTCVHPGWHRLDGWSGIRRAWQNIFDNSRPWRVSCEDVRVRLTGELAIVACVEVILPFGAREPSDSARLQATNVFAREDGVWRMVHHHASPVASLEEANSEETVH